MPILRDIIFDQIKESLFLFCCSFSFVFDSCLSAFHFAETNVLKFISWMDVFIGTRKTRGQKSLVISSSSPNPKGQLVRYPNRSVEKWKIMINNVWLFSASSEETPDEQLLYYSKKRHLVPFFSVPILHMSIKYPQILAGTMAAIFGFQSPLLTRSLKASNPGWRPWSEENSSSLGFGDNQKLLSHPSFLCEVPRLGPAPPSRLTLIGAY